MIFENIKKAKGAMKKRELKKKLNFSNFIDKSKSKDLKNGKN